MKNKSKKGSQNRKKHNTQDINLYDLGLEPPKIYRETQQHEYHDKSRMDKKHNDNLTRVEQRKKQTQKRKKRNTFRKFLVGTAIAVTLIAVGTILSLTVFFDITDITVTGNKKYKADQVLAQCTVNVGENLFLADTDTAKKMLEQNLPYIYNAKITRHLPATINIDVTESEPAYSISNKDKTYILLDNNFKVLELKAKKKKGITISKAEIKTALPGSVIEFNNKNTNKCLSELGKTIKANKYDKITAIYSNSLADNYVVYDGRIKFKLGTCDDLESKIYQGLTACEKLNASNPNAKGTMTINGGKSIYFTEEIQ